MIEMLPTNLLVYLSRACALRMCHFMWHGDALIHNKVKSSIRGIIVTRLIFVSGHIRLGYKHAQYFITITEVKYNSVEWGLWMTYI